MLGGYSNSRMNPIGDTFEYGSWKVDGQTLLVEYSNSVLDNIGATMAGAFRKNVGAGAQIGGVLFGKHGGGFVRIQAWRPLPLDEPDGLRSSLSSADELNLQTLIRSFNHDSKLRGLVPVGWTQSTFRRNMALEDVALDLYSRYFPEAWQVVLLIRPSFQRPTMAGFFFRESDGTIRTSSCYREFVLMPPGHGSTSRAPEPEAIDEQPDPAEETAPPTFIEQLAEKPGGRSRAPRWMLVAVLVLLAGAGAFFGLSRLLRREAQPPSLKLSEVGQQLRIEWDRAAEGVKDARSATLVITDDSEKTEKNLGLEELRGGSVTYQRRGADVSVRMSFMSPGQPPVLQSARFLGQPAGPQSELLELRNQVEELEQELKSAKEGLRKERTHANQLNDALKAMQKRTSEPRATSNP